jgi:hypothetical protein
MRRGLLPLSYFAHEGATAFEIDDELARHARVAFGSEHAERAAQVPVDLIFEQRSAGTVIAGELRAQGFATTVAVVFAESGHGQWNFAATEGVRFAEMLAEKRSLAGSCRAEAVRT